MVHAHTHACTGFFGVGFLKYFLARKSKSNVFFLLLSLFLGGWGFLFSFFFLGEEGGLMIHDHFGVLTKLVLNRS